MRAISVVGFRRTVRRVVGAVVPTLRGVAPVDVAEVTMTLGVGVIRRYEAITERGERLRKRDVLTHMHEVIDAALSEGGLTRGDGRQRLPVAGNHRRSRVRG